MGVTQRYSKCAVLGGFRKTLNYNTVSKQAGVWEPCKGNHIFNIVESQNALHVPLKAHPKPTMGDWAKLSQLQIPVNHKDALFTWQQCDIFPLQMATLSKRPPFTQIQENNLKCCIMHGRPLSVFERTLACLTAAVLRYVLSSLDLWSLFVFSSFYFVSFGFGLILFQCDDLQTDQDNLFSQAVPAKRELSPPQNGLFFRLPWVS